MNLLRTYGMPLFAVIPLAISLGLLWYYLLPFATSDGLMLLLFLFMCLFGIAVSALVQFVLANFSRPREEVDEKADESCEAKR
jgi:hypothetical protein